MTKFTASNFKGECTCDEDFVPLMQKMNDVAVQHEVTVIVISSYRKDAHVVGAIVTPATHSNHMVGHAVDVNLEYSGMYYNSVAMQKDLGGVHDFIQDCIKEGFRWGGNFGKPDPVHFDDSLNIKNFPLWLEKYNALHSTP